MNSYYPILIRYNDSKQETVINSPSLIDPGRSFVVLKTHLTS